MIVWLNIGKMHWLKVGNSKSAASSSNQDDKPNANAKKRPFREKESLFDILSIYTIDINCNYIYFSAFFYLQSNHFFRLFYILYAIKSLFSAFLYLIAIKSGCLSSGAS